MRQRRSLKGTLVKQLYEGHAVCQDPDVRLEFFPKSWLQHWLKQEVTSRQVLLTPVIDTSSLLCPHGQVCLTKISDLKCTSADLTSNVWAGFPRRPSALHTEDLCLTCVRQKIVSVKRAHDISEDQKAITDTLRIGSLTGVFFLVGLYSFKNWKDLAIAELEAQDLLQEKQSLKHEEREDSPDVAQVIPIEEFKPAADKTSPRVERVRELIPRVVVPDAVTASPATHSSSPAAITLGQDEDEAEQKDKDRYRFNQELMCEHGNLTTVDSVYRTVPRHVWRIFSKYFRDAPEFREGTVTCSTCRVRSLSLVLLLL